MKKRDKQANLIIINPVKIIIVVVLVATFVYVNVLQRQNIQMMQMDRNIAASTTETEGVMTASTANDKFVTKADIASLLQNTAMTNSQMLQMFPVGSIFMSSSGTNPGSYLGGTWVAWGSGRVPVGVNTSDGNFNAVEKTGGTASETLSVAQMPSHTHSFSGSAVTTGGVSTSLAGSFTGTAVNTGNNNVAATASFSGTAASTGNNSAGHTHTFSNGTSAAGDHIHDVLFYTVSDENADIGRNSGLVYGGGFANRVLVRGPNNGTVSTGDHSHYFSGTSDGSSVNHTHSFTAAGSVSLANTTHSHTVTAAGSVSLGNTTHTHSVTIAGSNSNTGSGGSHNNLQPYITYYMWKRTA
ncbi:MAG: hypothetical protein RR490_07820 [Niameybacter sp.]